MARPFKNAEERHSDRITIPLTKADKEDIEAAAKEEGTTPAAWARATVLRRLADFRKWREKK